MLDENGPFERESSVFNGRTGWKGSKFERLNATAKTNDEVGHRTTRMASPRRPVCSYTSLNNAGDPCSRLYLALPNDNSDGETIDI